MKKRILSLALALVLICTLLPLGVSRVHADTAGGCGEGLQWIFNPDSGYLTIQGYGPMDDYSSSSNTPWFSFRRQIKYVYMYGGTTIGNYAFDMCTELEEVTVADGVTRIGDHAFYMCLALESINIPEGVTYIGERAFDDAALTSISFPDSLRTIGEFSFFGCDKLTDVLIPARVTSIGEGAFACCDWLEQIVVATANPNYCSDRGVLLNKAKTELLQAPGNFIGGYAIPSGVKTIDGHAFQACESLTAVTIPDTVTSIGDYALYDCTGLKKMTVPASVTSIDYYAIGYCTVENPDEETSGFMLVPGFSMVVAANSTAHTHAKQHNIPFTLMDMPKVTAQPKSATVALGETTTFKVTATGSSIKYQWQFRKAGETVWYNWSGKTSASLPVTGSATNNGCQYRCVISNAVGHVNSAAVTLTVSGSAAKPTITTQPKSVSVALGASATFKVVASGSGLKYQWQYKKSGESSWTSWSGKTAASLTVTASSTNGGCQYRCVVSNSAGSVTSSAATLTVTGSSAKPTITTQPSNQSTTLGKSVTFKVVASGSGLSYQWQFSKDNGATWSSWSGKTSASLAVTASATNNGCLYRCVVKNSAGSVNSSSARMTVTNSKPVILVQPKAATVALGSSTTFKVVAWGSGLSYQWQFSKDGGTNWYDWSGKTSASLPVTGSSTNNGCLYRCVVKNSYGSVTSSQVKLTVN